MSTINWRITEARHAIADLCMNDVRLYVNGDDIEIDCPNRKYDRYAHDIVRIYKREFLYILKVTHT